MGSLLKLGLQSVRKEAANSTQLNANKCSAVAKMGDRMATIDIAQKLGGCAPNIRGRSCIPMLHNVAWAEAYLRTKWYLDPSSHLATTGMGRKKWGGLWPLF